MNRVDMRHRNFMMQAQVAGDMATCDRAHVGCVLVQGKRAIASGYNGAPSGMPHCDEVGHDMDGSHCVRTVHAEINAILQCAEFGVSTHGATCYCTTHPCVRCATALYSAGVRVVYYRDAYASMSSEDRARIASLEYYGMQIIDISELCHER